MEDCSLIDYSSWIERGLGNATDCSNEILQKYLLQSYAIGTSKRTDGLIDGLGIKKTMDAESFLEMLEENGFAISFEESAKAVMLRIQEIDVPNNEIWKMGEFAICTRSDASAIRAAVEQLEDFKTAENSIFKTQSDSVKRRFYEADSILRHIRNALAHGCFREVSIQGVPGFFFFDVNKQGNITAAISASTDRLNKWYTNFRKLEAAVAKTGGR